MVALSRTQEIYRELRGHNLSPEVWSLIAELVSRNVQDTTEMATFRAGVKAAEYERKLKDKERKRVSRSVQDSPLVLEIDRKEGGVGETNPGQTPFEILEPVVGGNRAHTILNYRKKIRKPLNTHSAELLAKRLKSCPNPEAAADEMIERGWTSVKPEWLLNGKGKGSVVEFKSSGPKRTWAEQKAEREAGG